MLDNINEIKEIISWAREKGILRLKVGEIEVEFHPSHFLSKVPETSKSPLQIKLEQEEKAKEEEELLTWST